MADFGHWTDKPTWLYSNMPYLKEILGYRRGRFLRKHSKVMVIKKKDRLRNILIIQNAI